ncbi:hypothetical protein AI2919V1_5478 (plasmid) [Klebsiella pneumoniae]|nr:hypothetical protein AI2919V1_5478 [Klebsiella pneumoniae]
MIKFKRIRTHNNLDFTNRHHDIFFYGEELGKVRISRSFLPKLTR